MLIKFLSALMLSVIPPLSAIASSGGPPDGYAGNPPQRRTCVNCHNSFGLNSGQGMLRLINLPETYQPGEMYEISVELSDPAARRWGFQLTAIDNQNQRAGEFGLINRQETQILARAGQPQYIEHTNAGTHRGQAGNSSWTVSWTAPADDIGPVTFYVAGNAANNNGAPSGDRIYAQSFNLQAAAPEPDRFTLRLAPGWNLISAPVIPDIVDLGELFRAPIEAELLVALRDRRGRLFDPIGGVNDIGEWPVDEAVQALLTAQVEVLFEGTLRDTMETISLNPGWNWVPYTRTDTLSAADAFAELGDLLTVAKDNSGLFYHTAYEADYIGAIVPGGGVMMQVTEAVEFRWPDPAGGEPAAPPPNLTHFAAPSNTGRNLSLLIREWRNFHPAAGDEVVVLNSEGDVAGASVVRDGDTPLVVWGDDTFTPEELDGLADGEEFYVRFWSAESDSEFVLTPECLIRCEFFNYHTDEFFPVALAAEEPRQSAPELSPAAGFQVGSAYPNPFNGEVSVGIILPRSAWVEAVIVDAAGRQVTRLASSEYPVGEHRLTWNAAAAPAGAYICRITALGRTAAVPFSLVR